MRVTRRYLPRVRPCESMRRYVDVCIFPAGEIQDSLHIGVTVKSTHGAFTIWQLQANVQHTCVTSAHERVWIAQPLTSMPQLTSPEEARTPHMMMMCLSS